MAAQRQSSSIQPKGVHWRLEHSLHTHIAVLGDHPCCAVRYSWMMKVGSLAKPWMTKRCTATKSHPLMSLEPVTWSMSVRHSSSLSSGSPQDGEKILRGQPHRKGNFLKLVLGQHADLYKILWVRFLGWPINEKIYSWQFLGKSFSVLNSTSHEVQLGICRNHSGCPFYWP